MSQTTNGTSHLTEVRFHPSGRLVRVAPGTTLMAATREAGLPIGSSCDGRGACGWCRVTVLEGEATSPQEHELELLAKVEASSAERIACQARVLGPLRITTTYW